VTVMGWMSGGGGKFVQVVQSGIAALNRIHLVGLRKEGETELVANPPAMLDERAGDVFQVQGRAAA